MAKKVLTPEEVQAKLEKKSAKRKIFFGTFTKALAFFLAIAMAWSLAAIAFTPATSVVGGAVAGGSTAGGNVAGGSTAGGSTAGGNAGSGDALVDIGGSGEDSGVAKADVVKALNDATAKASKGNYKWERKCYYTKDIDVGSATDTLNGIIQKADENATLGSVVGNFLGITGSKDDPAWSADVKGGKRPEDTKMKEDKYLLKAFSLTEADILQYNVDGNKYVLQLADCSSPQKDGANALNHITDDFITLSEVQKGVADGLGSLSNLLKVESCDVDFTAIKVEAEIKDGSLVNLNFTYAMNVKALNLKATLVPITGTGAGNVECTYSNFS